MLMMKQRGSAAILALAVIGMVIILGASIVMYAFSVRNGFVRIENQIATTYEDAKAMNSQYTLKIREMAQIPKMATNQLSELVEKTLSSRYGEDGSKALFQFIQEQNPSISPELYTNIQKTIAGGRSDFEAKMKMLNDSKRVAYNQLDTQPSGFILEFMGMPRKNIGYNGAKDDYPVIMSEDAQETFRTGVDKGVNLLE